MKDLLFIFLLSYSSLYVQAQDRRDTTFMYAGLAIRPDRNVPLELDLKYIQKNNFSAGLRFAAFSYQEFSGNVDVISDLNGIKNHISYEYNISGFSFKPGWIPLKVLKPKAMMSLGLYGVITHSTHDFSFEYSDVSGTSMEGYTRSLWNYGLEADWHFGLRFYRRFNLGASLILGCKQNNINLYGDIVEGMYTFKNYTPAQGKSEGPIYINAMLTFGCNF